MERCAWLLKEFHLLPEPGGVLDQDESLMDDIYLCWWWQQLAENYVEAEKKALEKARGGRP